MLKFAFTISELEAKLKFYTTGFGSSSPVSTSKRTSQIRKELREVIKLLKQDSYS